MIARAHRFHGYGSLRFVYQNGKTIRGPLMALKFVANPRRSSYRLAVVVSKKVNKSAVARNRIRRRLYEAVRQFETQLGVYDLVLTVFDGRVAELETVELTTQVHDQLRQAGVLAAPKTQPNLPKQSH